MAIIAASIEASGWVLKLTLTGSVSSAIVAGFNNSYATVLQAPDTTAQWATNFSAYALAPNSAAPALALAATSAGFVQAGGQAAASTAVARTLIGTKVLRKAVDATAAGLRRVKYPDEVDNGDGTITVRIALSQHVYVTDTGLSLAALAGWRTGMAAQTIAVTNGSTVAAPAPIVRWSDVPYQLQSGSFALECVVAAFHPNGLQPVAGVRFTVTDGTTIKTFWATALSTSTAYSAGGTGQGLRVYGVTVDPTTATALTKGLLRCDFKVFPWVGPAVASDTGDTNTTAVAASNASPSMTGLGTAALATANRVPFVVAYNPGGSWITPRYAYVDATNGSSTAAAANVSTSAAAAAATPLATVNLAIESLRLHAVANTAVGTVVAANGQSAITQSLDGCRIRLVAGVAFAGSTAVTFGANTAATWLVVEGDPANANPVANCILRSPATANGASRVTRVRLANLSVEAQTNAVLAVASVWADSFEYRGVSGQETTSGTLSGTTGGLVWATNGKWWRHGTPLSYFSIQIVMLARNVSTERNLAAPLVANCARLPSAVANAQGLTAAMTLTDPGYVLERIAVGNDLRYLNNVASGSAAGTGGMQLANANDNSGGRLTLGTTYPIYARCAALNNVGEVYGTAATLWGGVGENATVAASEFIIEGCTFTGDRTNNPYNDLNLATVALNDSENVQLRLFRFANNVTMKNASKHDTFNDATVQAQRIGVALSTTRNRAFTVGAQIVVAGSPANIYQCTTAGTTAATGGPTGTGSAITDGSVVWQWLATEARQHGFRPQATGAWASAYGVGYEGNIDLENANDPAGLAEFFFEFYGVGSQSLIVDGINLTATPFTNDQSGTINRQPYQPAPSGTGGGDYRPLATGGGPYILGRARTASVDRDQRGVVRGASFAAGALEGTATALAPASARQASLAASTAAGWRTTLATTGGRLASRAAASVAGWTGALTPAATRQAVRSPSPPVMWATTLAAAGGRLASRAAAAAVAWQTTIAAAAGRLASLAAPGATAWATVLVLASDRSAMAAASGRVTWAGSLAPSATRAAMLATSPAVTAFGTWLIAVDGGRIAVADRTLPILLPGWATPADRTLIVTGDFRNITIE